MIPSHLYHYTSINVLKLILKNRTIRFKRLDLLNDPLEGSLSEFSYLKRFIYTSSWTANKIDEIPMWNIYSNLRGVRLRLPIDLFCNSEGLKVHKTKNQYRLFSTLDKSYHYQFPDKKEFNKIYGPVKIDYLNSISELENNLIEVQKDGINLVKMEMLGTRKMNFWNFENEFRYLISPFIGIASSYGTLINGEKIFNRDLEFIDIGFNINALDNLELLFGPKTDIEEINEIKEILKLIELENYSILYSDIKIN